MIGILESGDITIPAKSGEQLQGTKWVENPLRNTLPSAVRGTLRA